MVDRDGFENRCTRKGTQGSNPCLSAIFLLGNGGAMRPRTVAIAAAISLAGSVHAAQPPRTGILYDRVLPL